MAEPMTGDQELMLRKRASADMQSAIATVDALRVQLAEAKTKHEEGLAEWTDGAKVWAEFFVDLHNAGHIPNHGPDLSSNPGPEFARQTIAIFEKRLARVQSEHDKVHEAWEECANTVTDFEFRALKAEEKAAGAQAQSADLREACGKLSSLIPANLPTAMQRRTFAQAGVLIVQTGDSDEGK